MQLESVYIFFFFLWPHFWPVEVPGLGIQSEPQLLATATATAMPDLSGVCDLHCSAQQHQILNPLSEQGIESATSWLLVRFVLAVPQ